MAKTIAALGIAAVGVAMLIFVGVYAVDAGIDNARHEITVTNESFTPDGGNLSVFNNSDLDRADYDETVTVRNETSGAELVEAGNYTWFEGNGTLKTTANSDLANASAATVTYGYLGHTVEQTAIANITVDTMGLLPQLGVIVFIVLVLAGAAILGRAA